MKNEQQPAVQPVAYRVNHPGYGSYYIAGLPSEADLEYCRQRGLELEYAYAHPLDPAEVMRLAEQWAYCSYLSAGKEHIDDYWKQRDEARAALARAVGAKDE